MTLEQMEKVLMDNVPAKFGRDEIRAALRAGQALQEEFIYLEGVGFVIPPRIKRKMQAWDAAVGEEK